MNKDISYGHWYPIRPGGMPEDLLGYQTEDKEPVWRYSMHQIDPKSYQHMCSLREQVPEHLVFRKRDDVFDFCMKLTEGI